MKKTYTLKHGVKKIRTMSDRVRITSGLAVVGLMAGVALPLAAHASPTQVVVGPPLNSQGWSTSDTRPGGSVSFVSDSSTPAGVGALKLTTDATTTSKAQYMHETNTPIAQVTNLSYYTKQNSASFVSGDASYQLPVCLGGFTTPTTLNPTGCVGFTTFVYEPYEQTGPTVQNGVWQSWDVDAGQFWSSRAYTDGTCSVGAGGGGAPFYTLAQIQTNCANAVAVGFGVNIGSNNPSYDVETDLVAFNDTEYNFEPYVAVSSKDACKNDGWKTQVDANGNGFKNQGACVSYVASGGKSLH